MSRNGNQTLVHYFVGDSPLAELDGMKRAIERDIAENFVVKVHHHEYESASQSTVCNCQIFQREGEPVS